MMTRLTHICILAAIVLVTACIDEYNPVINNYENLLVVDGGISDQSGPHTIVLSLSSSVSDPRFIPVENASMNILDDLGNSISASETEPGTYQTFSTVSGVVGRSYKIEITLQNGNRYDSDFEKLKKRVEIDTIYHEIVTRQEAGYDYDLYGYEFYVDTKQSEEAENYFKWDLEATYQYQSEYTIRWYYDGTLNWFHGPDSLYNCWTSYNVGPLFVSGTQNLTNPVIRKYPFHFVSTETRHLSVRYSLLVKQRTISKEAFEYWSEVEKQNGGESSLYASQPHFIVGNIQNISNPDEMVLGYFMVNGMDKMRIFVDRPPPEIPMRYMRCILTEADFEAYGQLGMMDPVYYPIYAIETPGGRRAVPHQDCVDCQRKGGSINKPQFWMEE